MKENYLKECYKMYKILISKIYNSYNNEFEEDLEEGQYYENLILNYINSYAGYEKFFKNNYDDKLAEDIKDGESGDLIEVKYNKSFTKYKSFFIELYSESNKYEYSKFLNNRAKWYIMGDLESFYVIDGDSLRMWAKERDDRGEPLTKNKFGSARGYRLYTCNCNEWARYNNISDMCIGKRYFLNYKI